MADTGIEIEGLREIYQALDDLPVKMKGNVLRSVNRKAAKIVQDEMKRNAPNDTIEGSIKIGTDKENTSGVYVGSSDKRAMWFEWGTVMRQTKKGANRGRINPTPFIERSIDAKIQEAQEFINNNLGELVRKTLERILRNTNRRLGT